MSRRTKADIRQVEGVINRALADYGYSHRLYVEWAYGQPRAYLMPVGGYPEKELSPRLPTGELYRWLCAYYEGLCMGLMVSEDKGE